MHKRIRVKLFSHQYFGIYVGILEMSQHAETTDTTSGSPYCWINSQ
jgi:hypothetical protein